MKSPPQALQPSAEQRPHDATALAEIVRDAAAGSRALRITGAGRWLDAGHPVHATVGGIVNVLELRGVVDYVPGDLTITARAGTPLAELQQVVRANGQWIPLDPWGGDAGTLGATLATATAGPSSASTGLPRDVVLGVEVVTGSGDVVRGGGRVVKNVAGFDLVRLMIGAWGTLGVITEATMRVRALPVCDESFVVPVPDGRIGEWLHGLRHAPLQATSLELLSARLAQALGAGERAVLLARLAGNAAAVAAQRTTLATFGAAEPVDSDVWSRLRTAEPPGASVCRFSAAPASLAMVWAHADDLLARAAQGWAHASVERGVVRVVVPSAAPAAELFALPAQGIARRYERLAPTLWAALAPRVRDELSARVRAAFDPRRVLNPGILGESPS